MDCLVQEVLLTRDVLVSEFDRRFGRLDDLQAEMPGVSVLRKCVVTGNTQLLLTVTNEAPAFNRTCRRPAHDILELA